MGTSVTDLRVLCGQRSAVVLVGVKKGAGPHLQARAAIEDWSEG